jgi:FkbM family methyltransferase
VVSRSSARADAGFCFAPPGAVTTIAAVSSALSEASAAYAQSIALKALARSPWQPRRVPLAYPRCVIETGGTAVASLYDEVFCQDLYRSPKPLPAAPRIVDAGGHLGMASLYFLFQYPGCRLTTLEPNPALASLLRRTLAPFGERATLFEAALSTRDGTVDFHITADNPINVTGGIDNREAPQREVRRLSVPCVDARALLREPIDLMKLDVEGHEFELLQLDQFEPRRVHNLVVEFHDLERREREWNALCRRLIEERGYRIATSDAVELSLSDLSKLTGCVVLKLF